MEHVDFYFDFSSAYSYLALPGVVRLAEKQDIDVCWKPFLLGAVFQSLHHAPPNFRTDKGRYIEHDIERRAASAGLSYQWPQPFPFNSLLAARMFWSLANQDDEMAIEWAKAVFHAAFGEGRDCSNSDVLAGLATGLGHDAKVLLESTRTDEIKQKLKQVTGEAMDRGLFGSPTFFVGAEMFWGSDRLSDLENFLEKA